MGGRASLTSKGEPIVSFVGDDRVRSLVVVAGITDRGFGYLENSDKGVPAGQDEIRGPYFETITIISKSCFKNSAIGKVSLSSCPRIVCQPAEGFVLTLPAYDSR